MDKQKWYRLNEDLESGEDSPILQQSSASSSAADQVVPPEASDSRNITLRTVNQSDIDLRQETCGLSQFPRRLFGDPSLTGLHDNSRSSIGNSSCQTSLSQHHLTESQSRLSATQSAISGSHLRSGSSSTLNSQLSADSLIVTPQQKKVWFGLNEDSASDSGDEVLIRLSTGSTKQEITQHSVNSTFHNTQYQTHLKYPTDLTYHEELTQHQCNSRSSETRLAPVGSAAPKNLTQYSTNSILSNPPDLTQHSNSVCSGRLFSDQRIEGALDGSRHSIGSSGAIGNITQHPLRSTLVRGTDQQSRKHNKPARIFDAELSEIIRPSSSSVYSSSQRTLNLTNTFGRFSDGSTRSGSTDVSKITFTRGQSGTLPSFHSPFLESISDSSKSSKNESGSNSTASTKETDKFKDALISYVSSDLSPRKATHSTVSQKSVESCLPTRIDSSESSTKSSPNSFASSCSYHALKPEQNSASSDSSGYQTRQCELSTLSPVNSQLADSTNVEKSQPNSNARKYNSTQVKVSVSKIPKLVASLPKQKLDKNQKIENNKSKASELHADSLFRQTIVSGSSEFVKNEDNCSCTKQREITSSSKENSVKCSSRVNEDQVSSLKSKLSPKPEAIPTKTECHSITANHSTSGLQRTAPEGICDNSAQLSFPSFSNTKKQPLTTKSPDISEDQFRNRSSTQQYLNGTDKNKLLSQSAKQASISPNVTEPLLCSKQKSIDDPQLKEPVKKSRNQSVRKSNLTQSMNTETQQSESLYLTNKHYEFGSDLTESLCSKGGQSDGYSRQPKYLDSTDQTLDVQNYKKKSVDDSDSKLREVLDSPSETTVDLHVTEPSYYPLSEDSCISYNTTEICLKMSEVDRENQQEPQRMAQVPNLSFNDSSKDSTSLHFASPRGNHRNTSSDDDWRSETDGTTSEAEVGSPANPAYDQMLIGVSHEAVHEALSEILQHEAVNTVVSEISNDFVSGNLSMDGGRSSDSSQLSSDKEDGAIEREFRGSISGLYPESYGGYSDVDWNIYTSNESDNNLTPRSVASSGEREAPSGAYLSQNFEPLKVNNSTIDKTDGDTVSTEVLPFENSIPKMSSASPVASSSVAESAFVEIQENQAAGDSQITQESGKRSLPEHVETQADPNVGDVQMVDDKELLPQEQVFIAMCKTGNHTTIADLRHGPNVTQGDGEDHVDQDGDDFEPKPDQNDSTSSESGRGSGSKSASLSEDYNLTKHDETSYYSEFSRENSNVSDVPSTDGKPFTDVDLKERLKQCEQDLMKEDSELPSSNTSTLMGYTSEYITREEREQILNSHNHQTTGNGNSSLKDESSTSEMFAVMNKTFNSDLSMGTIPENAREATGLNSQNFPSRESEQSRNSLASITGVESLSKNINLYSLDQTDSSEFCSTTSVNESVAAKKTSLSSSGDYAIITMTEPVLVNVTDSDNQRPKSSDGDTTDTESSTSTLKHDVVNSHQGKSNYDGVPITKEDYENISVDVSGRSSTPTVESQQPPNLECFVPVIDLDTKDDPSNEASAGIDWKSIQRPLSEVDSSEDSRQSDFKPGNTADSESKLIAFDKSVTTPSLHSTSPQQPTGDHTIGSMNPAESNITICDSSTLRKPDVQTSVLLTCDESAVSTSDDDARSTDDLSRKVEHLLNNTAHLAEQTPRKHIEGISLIDPTNSRTDLDYDSLHRDLDEIQVSLKSSSSVPKIDVENSNPANSTVETSPKLSFRSACGTGSPTSLSDLDTSRRRFLWDYGADIGYDDGQSRFIGNIKDLTGTEADINLTNDRDMSTANSSRCATPMFEHDRTNHTITEHNFSTQTEEESHSLEDADETLDEAVQHLYKNFSNTDLIEARKEVILREALARETEQKFQTTYTDKDGLAHRVNQLLEKDDPKKQAGDILRDISAEERNFFRQMADDRRGNISNDSDNSSTTAPKIAQRKGIELSPRIHRPPPQENYFNSPTLQRILKKNSTENKVFDQNSYSPPTHSGYYFQAPSSSALSNAKTFLSGQLEKMSTRQFDQSIELRSPVRRVINCYPVFGATSAPEDKDSERESSKKRNDQPKLGPEDNMKADIDTGTTDDYQQNKPVSRIVEIAEEQTPSVRPTPTGASDVPPPQTSAVSGAQKAIADSRILRGQTGQSSADYRSPNPVVGTVYSDWKHSPGNSEPNSSPSSFTTTSPSDSDYSGSKRQTATQKFRPYRPVGGGEMYYYTGSETDDKTSVADSVTTMESTHLGSDDAKGPDFPASALGSRQEAPQTQGVYGTRVKEQQPAAMSLSTIEERSQSDERDRSLSLENLQTDNQASANEISNRNTEEQMPRERTDGIQGQDGPSPRTQAILDRVDQTLKDQGSRSNQSGLKVKGDDPEFQPGDHNYENKQKKRAGNNGEHGVPEKEDYVRRPSSNGREVKNASSANSNLMQKTAQRETYMDNSHLHERTSISQRDLNRRERELCQVRAASALIGKVSQPEFIRGLPRGARNHFSLQGTVSEPVVPGAYTADNHAKLLSKSYEELSFLSHDAARGSSSMVSHARSPLSLYHSPILSQESITYSPSTRHTDTRISGRDIPLDNKGSDYVSVTERRTLLTRFSPLQVDEEEDVPYRRSDERMYDERMDQPRRSTPQTKLVEPYSQPEYHHKPRENRAFDRDNDMVEFDRAPVSRMASLLQESLQRDPELHSGLPANINLFWDRFQQMQSESDSSMDSSRLEALADLMRNPSKHVVNQYICDRENERRRREASVEREREERRREDKERKRLTLSAKRQKIVDGSYSETLEESNGYSSERSRDGRGFRKHDQSPLKPYQRELSYDSSVVDTLYSIPEDPSIDLGNSLSTSSDTYQAAPKTSKRQRHVIDPHMQKLKSKISKQRLKYEKQKRKEAQRLAKIQHLEQLLVAKKAGRISSKAFEKEMANLSSCTERTSSSEMSSEVSTMLSTRDSTNVTSVSSQLSSEQSTATITPRSTSEDSTLTDTDWARVPSKPEKRENKQRQRSEPLEPKRSRKETFTSPTRPEKTKRESNKERQSPQRRKKSVEDPPFATQKVKYSHSSSSPQRSGKSPSREKHGSDKSRKEPEIKRTADVSVMYPSPQVSPKKKKGPKMVSLAVQTTPRLAEKLRERSVSRSPSPRSSHKGRAGRHHSKEKPMRHRSVSPKPRRTKSAENKPPKRNRRSLNDADMYNRSGISWYVPMDDPQPWRKPLKERQAYAMSRNPDMHQVKSALGVDLDSMTHPAMFQRRSAPPVTEGDMMSEVESFMEMYLTKSRQNQNKDKERDILEEKERPLSQMSLQEAFLRYKSNVVSRLNARQKRIMLASKERELQEILGAERAQLFRDHRYTEENNDYHPLSENLFKPKKRSMSKQEMKELTARLYYKLPEVLQKEVDKKRQDDYKVNRIKAKLFNKKVQRKLLGKPVPWYE